MPDDRSISLPEDLYKACEARVASTTFESVDEYVAFVLREVVEEQAIVGESCDDSADVPDDQLEALGYLDR